MIMKSSIVDDMFMKDVHNLNEFGIIETEN